MMEVMVVIRLYTNCKNSGYQLVYRHEKITAEAMFLEIINN